MSSLDETSFIALNVNKDLLYCLFRPLSVLILEVICTTRIAENEEKKSDIPNSIDGVSTAVEVQNQNFEIDLYNSTCSIDKILIKIKVKIMYDYN